MNGFLMVFSGLSNFPGPVTHQQIAKFTCYEIETIFTKEMFAEALGLILVEEKADNEHIVEEGDMVVL